LRGKDDGLTALAPIRDRFPYFADLLPASQRLICSPACAPQRALAGRSETTAFSPVSSDETADPSSQASSGRSRQHRKAAHERYRRVTR
jgi:hypothetical protein